MTLKLWETATSEHWKPLFTTAPTAQNLARDLNLRAHEGGWFGASSYGCEFPRIPYAAFIPTLEDESIVFEEEEPLPQGYRPGDIVL